MIYPMNYRLMPIFFAEDTSLFSAVHNVESYATELKNDLAKINHCANQLKMSFNPDPSKEAHDVIFNSKVNKDSHPLSTSNNNIAYQTTSKNHLGTILDNCESFEEYPKLIFSKINKTVGLLRKLQCLILRSTLLTKYKTFVRLHLDYGEIICKQAYNSSFHQKIEPVQYNACLAVTRAIRVTSKEELYDNLA